jgi:hypothetical protein
MPNIKFSYFYRDGANYKKFDDVIFANPDSVNLSEIESIISGKLIEETWFYADEWKLPESTQRGTNLNLLNIQTRCLTRLSAFQNL